MQYSLILDTDIGTDSDDIGALMVMHNLNKQRKLNILAVTSCTSRRDAVAAIDIINNYYCHNVPVGMCKKYHFFDTPEFGHYSRAMQFSYSSKYKNEDAPCAVKVLRRALFESKEKVCLVTIGYFNNIRDLIESGADEICGKSGLELLNEKVESAYFMAGNFENNIAEWNVKCDIKSFQTVISLLQCPITFLPYEAGAKVLTGQTLLNSKDTPMKMGYYIQNITPRSSWDPMTVFIAVEREQQLLKFSDWGKVSVDDCGITTFSKGNGRHRYVLSDFDEDAVQDMIESLMKI